jgi:cold shock CspA family protein
MTRTRGTITHWNRRKAYGFITPTNEAEEVFAHISEFRDRREMPSLEEQVEYVLSTDKQGRPCATDVERIDGKKAVAEESGNSKWIWVIGAVVVLVAAGVIFTLMR